MKVEYIEPFVNAVFTVLETVAGVQMRTRRACPQKHDIYHKTITIMAGVNGDLEGAAMYGMSMITAEKIASGMMGCPIQQFDEMAMSAVSELGNMIQETRPLSCRSAATTWISRRLR